VPLRPSARQTSTAAIAALALATITVGAVAATSDSEPAPRATATVTACVGQQSGAMRLETKAKPCRVTGSKKLRERRITWNQRGVAGARGPSGATGVPGAAASEGALAAGEFTASAPVAPADASFAALPFDDHRVLRDTGIATGEYRGLTAEAVEIQETGTYRVSLSVTLDPGDDPVSSFTFISARLLDQPDGDFSDGLLALAAVSQDLFPAASVDRTVHLEAGDLVAPLIESNENLDVQSFFPNVGVSFTVEQLD
jgi:hypothetical protein